MHIIQSKEKKQTKEFMAKLIRILDELKYNFKDCRLVGVGTGSLEGATGVLLLYGPEGEGTILHLDWSSAINVAFGIAEGG